MTLLTSECQKLTQGSLTQLSVFLSLFIFSNSVLAVSIVQDTADCQDDKTECQQEEKSSTPPRDAVMYSFRVRLATLRLLTLFHKTADK